AVPGLIAASILPTIEWTTWPAAWHAHLAAGEPFGTLAFGVIAIALYVHRTRSADLQRRTVKAESDSGAMQQIAQMALAVRDLANTPLQTLERELDAMQQDGGRSNPEAIERMGRSLSRLRELNQLLKPYEAMLEQRGGAEPLASLEMLRRGRGEP